MEHNGGLRIAALIVHFHRIFNISEVIRKILIGPGSNRRNSAHRNSLDYCYKIIPDEKNMTKIVKGKPRSGSKRESTTTSRKIFFVLVIIVVIKYYSIVSSETYAKLSVPQPKSVLLCAHYMNEMKNYIEIRLNDP